MTIQLKPSDLRYKYRHNTPARHLPPFTGKPDPTPFDRDSLHEVLGMLGRVMDALDSDSALVLEAAEEMMVQQMPSFIATREEVYDFLCAVMRERLGDEVD